MARRKSASGGRPVRPTTNDPSELLHARLLGFGRQRAAYLGYTVTGLRALDTIRPARGVLWVQLTRGSLVVWCAEEAAHSVWSPTLAEAQEVYHRLSAKLRALDG